MVEEYHSIIKNSVWEVVPRLADKSVVGSIWFVKLKHVVDGSIEQHKAIFLDKGFSQVEVIDYDKTFSLIVRYSSMRTILALLVKTGWTIHQRDVKSAFLNGFIEEDVYIEQPEGFETFDRDFHVFRLKRVLYGLKQEPCSWHTTIDSYLTSL